MNGRTTVLRNTQSSRHRHCHRNRHRLRSHCRFLKDGAERTLNFSRLYFVVSLLPLPLFQSRHVLPKCPFWSRFSTSFFVNHVYLRVVSSLIRIISSTRTTRSRRLFRSSLDDLLYPSSALLHSLSLFLFLFPLPRYHIHGVCVRVCVRVCVSVCSFIYTIIGSQ